MFGYITIYQKELKIKDYDLYRSYYCGLCHALKKQYGRTGQMLLNYDMTFLAVLLSSLYEPEEKTGMVRCIPHPVRAHQERSGEVFRYAADMTVLLAREKALDDWTDEKKLPAKALASLLKRRAGRAGETWKRQKSSLRENVAALSEAERNGEFDIDRMAGYTGRFLGEIFVWKEDIWEQHLRRLGYYLGKFIYLRDAWEDREKDRKKGSYNLFLSNAQHGKEYTDRQVLDMLTDTMAHACAAFERLPVVECADILRNILYAGVWSGFAPQSAEQ